RTDVVERVGQAGGGEYAHRILGACSGRTEQRCEQAQPADQRGHRNPNRGIIPLYIILYSVCARFNNDQDQEPVPASLQRARSANPASTFPSSPLIKPFARTPTSIASRRYRRSCNR